MLEKAAALTSFKYSVLRKELKAQTIAAEKQYQGSNKLFKSDEKEESATITKEKPIITDKSNLVHDRKYSFTDYINIGKYYDLLFMTTYNQLSMFYHQLTEFRSIVPGTKETK